MRISNSGLVGTEPQAAPLPAVLPSCYLGPSSVSAQPAVRCPFQAPFLRNTERPHSLSNQITKLAGSGVENLASSLIGAGVLDLREVCLHSHGHSDGPLLPHGAHLLMLHTQNSSGRSPHHTVLRQP